MIRDKIVSLMSGCSSGRLPGEYVELEYIENPSSAYIKTGLYPGGHKYSAEVKFCYTSIVASSGYPCLFSCFENERVTTGNCYNFGIYNGKWRYKLERTYGSSTESYDNAIHTIHFNKDDGTHLDDGVYWITNRLNVSPINNVELPLFTRIHSGVGRVDDANFVGRVYYAKFWNDYNELIRDFVPAKRDSDSVLGMYDLVSGQFFTNAGTGEFIGGDPV